MAEWVRAGTVAEIESAGHKVVSVGGAPVLVLPHEGSFRAIDNRCPHMGFPLHQGNVKDGLLDCHWHHARFDVTCGATLDPWADDVDCYRVVVEDGAVFVDPRSLDRFTRLYRAASQKPHVLFSGESSSATAEIDGLSDWAEYEAATELSLLPAASDKSNAYIMFTSGSSGRPKGVPISHGNVTAFIDAALGQFPIGSEDRTTQTFDLSFDLAILTISRNNLLNRNGLPTGQRFG